MHKAPEWLRAVTHMCLALPLLWLCGQWLLMLTTGDARSAGLTSDPIAATINTLGLWAFRILLLALAITPVRRLTGWTPIMAIRRAVGLWAFAYAGLHLASYLGLDLFGSLDLLWDDIIKRRYILFGMAAFLCLIPLAITSTRGWMRRLGGRRWQQLHRLAYAAGGFAAVHFILRVRGFQYEPWLYALILGGLLVARLRLKAVARSRG